MRKYVCVLGVLALAAPALGLAFTEDFNSYQGGSTTWNSGGVWNEPTTGLKLDAYTYSGTLGPRTGNSGNRAAHAELGESGGPAITFSQTQMWDHARCKADAMFVVLSDDPATALQVPASGSLANPINAIAWGHAATDSKNFSFFDGKNSGNIWMV